jgi:2-oxoisovalerate dehydrogenase E1 component beta subunit
LWWADNQNADGRRRTWRTVSHFSSPKFYHEYTDTRRSYHSQSPEALFTHTPGLRVVIPRSPIQAKGLLLSSIQTADPVIFMEPKILYRAAVEQVPVSPYYLPLDKAEIMKSGTDLTIISYGTPLYTCGAAIAAAEKDFGCSVELIDLRTIYPWDRQTVLDSVSRTGRAIVVHESMMNAGVGAEVAATIQEKAFLRLEAPVKRVTGWATHTGLVYEPFIVPDVTSKFFPLISVVACRWNADLLLGVYDAIRQTLDY